jgi:hypothetical protein
MRFVDQPLQSLPQSRMTGLEFNFGPPVSAKTPKNSFFDMFSGWGRVNILGLLR